MFTGFRLSDYSSIEPGKNKGRDVIYKSGNNMANGYSAITR
jgi:hypothetical protein